MAYLEFGSRGIQPLPFVLRGQFLLNYNNFVLSENMISEHIAIFKKNICKFFNPLLPELRKNILNFFFDVILFRMGRKIYTFFLKIFNLKKMLLYEGHGRLAR